MQSYIQRKVKLPASVPALGEVGVHLYNGRMDQPKVPRLGMVSKTLGCRLSSNPDVLEIVNATTLGALHPLCKRKWL